MDIKKLDRKKIYEIYCRIRYIVQTNHCEPISINEVINRINEHHKDKLLRLFNYDNELIECVLNYVKENKK